MAAKNSEIFTANSAMASGDAKTTKRNLSAKKSGRKIAENIHTHLFRKPVRRHTTKNLSIELRTKKRNANSLQKQRIDKSVDMWALGSILFTIMHGYPPLYATKML